MTLLWELTVNCLKAKKVLSYTKWGKKSGGGREAFSHPPPKSRWLIFSLEHPVEIEHVCILINK